MCHTFTPVLFCSHKVTVTPSFVLLEHKLHCIAKLIIKSPTHIQYGLQWLPQLAVSQSLVTYQYTQVLYIPTKTATLCSHKLCIQWQQTLVRMVEQIHCTCEITSPPWKITELPSQLATGLAYNTNTHWIITCTLTILPYPDSLSLPLVVRVDVPHWWSHICWQCPEEWLNADDR